jgi:O-succinylbenzoic acid--CoA ligase
LNRLVAGMASQLTAAGVGAGQQVAVLLPNRVEYVCLIHALARLGAVLVPLNIRLTGAELGWQVGQAGCSFVVCSQQTEAQAVDLAQGGRRILSVDPPQASSVEAFTEVPAHDLGQWQSRPLNLEAVQGIVYTSGTTGRAKGAMLTYGNHLWSAMASAYRLGTDPADRWLVCMPLYHVGGMAIIWRCCLYGTTVVLQTGFDPLAVSRALDSQGISLISLVPTMLHRLLEAHRASLTASTLRYILLGGAAAPQPLLEECLALNLPVATTYGLSEAASQVATALPAEAYRKPGSVGKPLMFSEVHIAGEHGQELPPGEIGEIVVCGPTVMQGYYDQPQATRKILPDGRLHTGDMGYLDQEGDLWVIQRRADLIVTGGENVYPAEVEQVLREHPQVADVCVVGLEDEEWGQRVAAAVVIDGADGDVTEVGLITFCRERLAGYKQPRLIRFVDVLPRTASGKVRRDVVRKQIKLSISVEGASLCPGPA